MTNPWGTLKGPSLRRVNLTRDSAFGHAKVYGDKESKLRSPLPPRCGTEYSTLPLSSRDISALADTLLDENSSTHVGFTEDGRPYLYCDRPKARRIPKTKRPVSHAKVTLAHEKSTASSKRRSDRATAIAHKWDDAVMHNALHHPEWFSVKTLKEHGL